jgi:hypothetical protein
MGPVEIVRVALPVEIMCVTAEGKYGLPQNAELQQMGRDACKAAEQAQIERGDERTRLLDLSQTLRQRELVGWIAFGRMAYEDNDTVQMPDGALLGASMAAMGIANVHLLRGTNDGVKLAREWYERAEALCPKTNNDGVVKQRNNIQLNKQQLQLFESIRLLHKRVKVKNLVFSTQYNGRRGKVMKFNNKAKKYEVHLDAVNSEIGSKVEFCATLILVHSDNLEEL